MRIGIDATPLPPNPVGAGTYIVELIRALAALETEHEFVIFIHQGRRPLIDVPATPRIHWVLVPDKSPARRLVWEQTIFPWIVKRSGVQILHSLHYTRPLFLPCASVVTFMDMTFFLYPQLHTRSKRIFFPTAIRLSARLANALASISENTRRDAIRILGLSPQKIFTTPMGVKEAYQPITDPARLETCRQKYNLPENFILYVGAIEPRKNLPLLLKAYSHLVDELDCQLVIVGRLGWMYDEVLHQVKALQLEDKAIFTGYVPAEDLPVFYNLAKVFVYPSLYEGSGLPPLEAMACGTPVITTNVSSMADQVGDAGILVAPQDEEALTQAIKNVITDPLLQQQLSAKGLAQAKNFTWKHTAEETLKVYELVGATL